MIHRHIADKSSSSRRRAEALVLDCAVVGGLPTTHRLPADTMSTTCRLISADDVESPFYQRSISSDIVG